MIYDYDDLTGTTYPVHVIYRTVVEGDYKREEIIFEPIKPLPPYRERLRPRKYYQRRPYWLRIRSNPTRRNYH